MLAIGNYMNKGKRGNAYGFKLSSLAKLIDTKSSKINSTGNAAPALQRQINLCHYLAEIIPIEILSILLPDHDFYENLNGVQGLTFTDCKKEMKVLLEGHTQLKIEIDYLNKRLEKGAIIPNDDFLTVMKPFQALVNLSLSEINDNLNSAIKNYEKARKYFVEDNTVTADKFFGCIYDFSKDLQKAKEDNDLHDERVESEKKKNKLLAINKTNSKFANERSRSNDRLDVNSISNRQLTTVSSSTSASSSTPMSPENLRRGNPVQRNGTIMHITGNGRHGEADKSEDFDDLLNVIKSGDLFAASNRRVRQGRVTHY